MNALLSEDHALTLVEQRFNKVIFGDKSLSLENWLDEIEKVTKKMFCRVARQVKLQSLFFLEGGLRMAALKKTLSKIDEEVYSAILDNGVCLINY